MSRADIASATGLSDKELENLKREVQKIWKKFLKIVMKLFKQPVVNFLILVIQKLIHFFDKTLIINNLQKDAQ